MEICQPLLYRSNRSWCRTIRTDAVVMAFLSWFSRCIAIDKYYYHAYPGNNIRSKGQQETVQEFYTRQRTGCKPIGLLQKSRIPFSIR